MDNNFNNPKIPKSKIKYKQEGIQQFINPQPSQISLSPEAFDAFIQSQGILVEHYKAIPDPRGMKSRGDTRDALGIRDSSDGFIYKKAGELFVLSHNNSMNIKNIDIGEISDSFLNFVVPRFYNNSKELVLLHPFDKFYIKNIEVKVVNVQYIEKSETDIDILQYPAIDVEFLIDSNGKQYTQNTDFIVDDNGNIKWISPNRPIFNSVDGRGMVLSVRYTYIPYFVILRIMHEIRVTQISSKSDNSRTLERMPMVVQVARETIFRDVNINPNNLQITQKTQSVPSNNNLIGQPLLHKNILNI